jgi:retron-type reverse transcriptase
MRTVQYRILTKILDKIKIPNYIYAFEKDKSIPVMTQEHINKRVVISIDIKDFFHSIKQTSLFEMFTSMGMGGSPARTLSELCTYKAYVPQGALTSPKISNIIAAKTFGPLLREYCDSKNYTLTIYADDITVSMNRYTDSLEQIIKDISEFVTRFGFRINKKKTKIMGYYQRQWVCGVVVNKKTNMLKKDRLLLRAIVHNITRNGVEEESLKAGAPNPSTFLSSVKGRIGWLKQLNQPLGDKLLLKLNTYLKTLGSEIGAESEVVMEEDVHDLMMKNMGSEASTT